MKTIKSFLLIIVLFSSVNVLFAQTSAHTDDQIQKAFSTSYAQEYKKAYIDAVNTMKGVYAKTNYEMNLRLGWLYLLSKDYVSSSTYYQRAAEIRPYSIEAKFGVIKPCAVLEKWDEVQKQYDAILKIDEQNSQANYWRGMIDYNAKKYDGAAKYFEKVINLYPFDYDSNLMLAWTYLSLGKSGEAKILFNKVLLISPADASAKEGLSKLN